MLLKDAVDRLNGMWCYDNLTMLYNRSGFSYEAKTMMDRFKDANMDAYIIFMDADGLKTANDTLGHDVGDMDDTNQSGKYPFKLSASIGVSICKARDIENLDEVIEQADQKMYQEKRAKKDK